VDAFLSYNVLAHALGTQRQALKEHADVERESSASRMPQKALKDMIAKGEAMKGDVMRRYANVN
jgi:hypothetical protein